MTVAAVGNQPVGLAKGIFQISGAVHGKHRAELLMGEFLGKLHGFHFAYEHLCAFRHGNTGQCGDLACALTDYLGVQRTVDENGAADLVQVITLEEPAATVGKFRLDCLIDAVQHNNALL